MWVATGEFCVGQVPPSNSCHQSTHHHRRTDWMYWLYWHGEWKRATVHTAAICVVMLSYLDVTKSFDASDIFHLQRDYYSVLFRCFRPRTSRRSILLCHSRALGRQTCFAIPTSTRYDTYDGAVTGYIRMPDTRVHGCLKDMGGGGICPLWRLRL